VVSKQIKELQRARDEAGVRIWSLVAHQLADLSKEGAGPPRRPYFFE
jgi:hypothetical protein